MLLCPKMHGRTLNEKAILNFSFITCISSIDVSRIFAASQMLVFRSAVHFAVNPNNTSLSIGGVYFQLWNC